MQCLYDRCGKWLGSPRDALQDEGKAYADVLFAAVSGDAEQVRSYAAAADRVIDWRNGPSGGAVRSPHLRRDWGPPRPHLHRDWAHPRHICTGTGPTPATSAPGLGSQVWGKGSSLPLHYAAFSGEAELVAFLLDSTDVDVHAQALCPHLRRDWAHFAHICVHLYSYPHSDYWYPHSDYSQHLRRTIRGGGRCTGRPSAGRSK